MAKKASKEATAAAEELLFQEALKGIAAKVNTANITELKNAIDDGVKLNLTKAGFIESHRNEDIRLYLGYSSAIIAFAAAYYGYTNDFQESKLLVTIGVGINLILSAALAYHVKFVEKDIIFTGKRRTIAARISTETITISSNASTGNPPSFSPQNFLLSFVLPSPKPLPKYPCYDLVLSYVNSSNAGKSIIRSGESGFVKSVGAFFDASGRFCQAAVDGELGKLVTNVIGE